MSEAPSLRKSVKDAEPELRAALQDVLERFGAKATVELELPSPDELIDDPGWEGNIYKYSF